ncbi:hypothetical protein E2C01_085846 [Portunus trituberculatus]|uniref:Uncharacterized protein n=1 Tax=Portunus trituberculatus TaxID=210409 RepID=A0A5B7J8N8_PORTR|nr:hypothetical protein [Portunus trituberculatus]
MHTTRLIGKQLTGATTRHGAGAGAGGRGALGDKEMGREAQRRQGGRETGRRAGQQGGES